MAWAEMNIYRVAVYSFDADDGSMVKVTGSLVEDNDDGNDFEDIANIIVANMEIL